MGIISSKYNLIPICAFWEIFLKTVNDSEIHIHFLSIYNYILCKYLNFFFCCYPAAETCNSKQVACATGGQCVLKELVCDLFPDCDDGSDEYNCSKYLLFFGGCGGPYSR